MNARVPADIDMADRVVGSFTARQVVILGADALVLFALWSSLGRLIPPFVFGVIAAPLAAVGVVWATVKVEGSFFERIAASGWRYLRTPRRRVLAPEGLTTAPAWIAGSSERLGAIELPFEGVGDAGALDLGELGAAIVCRASSVNFELRSDVEQTALIDGFGRLLNALDGPVLVLVRSDRADVDSIATRIEAGSMTLPHVALESAAKQHAQYLRSLGARRDVLSRQIFVCFRGSSSVQDDAAVGVLRHRVETTAALLRGLGIQLDPLDASEAGRALVRACDPESPRHKQGLFSDEPVEGVV
ncbi:MAG: PrgI family protein [Actinomycetota bacterium]